MIRSLLVLLALLLASPALAVDFPRLSGRVVDQADLLTPADEAALTQRLEALQRATSRQLVVATVSSLQDLPIEDYGYQLGRAWNIGQRGANNGVILLVAPNERRTRIEVGYGLEPIVTDALSSQIVNQMLPRFRANDYPGGINAGADALIRQLQAPPEAAERAALAAQQAENQRKARSHGRGGTPTILVFLFWIGMVFIIVVPLLGAGFGGRRYRGRHGVSIWGPGTGGGDNGFGWMLAGMVLGSLNDRHRGGGWDGGDSSWSGGSWGGGGGGGFSGGGGSFGGGGASGGW